MTNEGNIPLDSILVKSTTNEVEQPTSFYNRKKVEGDGSVTTLPSLSTIKGPKKTAIPTAIQTTPPNSQTSNSQDRQTDRQTDQQANQKPRRQIKKKSESAFLLFSVLCTINYITCFYEFIVLYRSISVNELFSAHLRTESPLKFGVLLILRTFLGALKSVC